MSSITGLIHHPQKAAHCFLLLCSPSTELSHTHLFGISVGKKFPMFPRNKKKTKKKVFTVTVSAAKTVFLKRK